MPYTSLTLGQLRSLLDNQLGESAPALWRVDEKNKIIRDMLRLWNLLTGYWKGAFLVTTVANQPWYALPSPLVQVATLRVEFQSRSLRVESRFNMDHGRDGWEAETTASGGDVPRKPHYYVVGASNLIGIWPADAVGGSQMVVNSILRTPVPTLDGDTIDLAPELVSPFLNGAQALAVIKEGGVEAATAGPLLSQFLASAGEHSAVLRASSIYRQLTGLSTGRMKLPFRNQSQRIGAR